ncbi:hypothetical protein DL89DRAFT_59135 [Linderina pennispora]|uniref:Uncharacterized protein n=1 Tax=Linderina pennispora TaxID=61395 RepID=A0A1Y1VZP1_9FUNG|nr:uncharacterized protein DL89DRAFT_59135 [Linderina pennispora]ORX66738.1 hypothetical protein DL89DRAFT_59135 [Linderina pennispora]
MLQQCQEICQYKSQGLQMPKCRSSIIINYSRHLYGLFSAFTKHAFKISARLSTIGAFHPGFGPHMYRHHCRGSLKGKIIFFGVTLWLTSTVIAGVRRASGWTHNAHSLTQSSAEPDERRKQWRRMMDERLAASRQFAEARFQQLEQHYGTMVADEQTRQQWKQWLSMEKEKLINEWTRNSLWFERNMDRFHNPDAYQNGCHRPGGFMRWYLGRWRAHI